MFSLIPQNVLGHLSPNNKSLMLAVLSVSHFLKGFAAVFSISGTYSSQFSDFIELIDTLCSK